MVDNDTDYSVIDPSKILPVVRSHRAPRSPIFRRVLLSLIALLMIYPLAPIPGSHTGAPVVAAPATGAVPLGLPPRPPIDAAPIPLTPEEIQALTDERKALADRISRDQRRKADEAKAREAASKVETVISFALAQRGKPYVWAASGPNGFDCSGLVLAAYAQIGIELYHYTGVQMTKGKYVPRSELQRGDIVFPTAGHVGIYLGDGKLIHASSGRGRVVVDNSFTYYTARRLL
jgi:cell wall-associated NlpC family hydrolase